MNRALCHARAFYVSLSSWFFFSLNDVKQDASSHCTAFTLFIFQLKYLESDIFLTKTKAQVVNDTILKYSSTHKN